MVVAEPARRQTASRYVGRGLVDVAFGLTPPGQVGLVLERPVEVVFVVEPAHRHSASRSAGCGLVAFGLTPPGQVGLVLERPVVVVVVVEPARRQTASRPVGRGLITFGLTAPPWGRRELGLGRIFDLDLLRVTVEIFAAVADDGAVLLGSGFGSREVGQLSMSRVSARMQVGRDRHQRMLVVKSRILVGAVVHVLVVVAKERRQILPRAGLLALH